MNKLERIVTKNGELDRIQYNVAKAYDPIVGNPILSYTILNGVEVGTAPTIVAHGLGRKYVGWHVIRKTMAGDVWESVTQPAPNSTISLEASAPITVSIYIF